MRLTHRFAFLLVLDMFFAFPLEAAFTFRNTSPQGFYSGRLSIAVRTDKFLISEARVTVSKVISFNPINIKTFKGKTNRYGEYNLSGLDAGTYGIRIEVPGYSPQADRVLVGPGLISAVHTYEMILDQSVMGVVTGKVLNRLGEGIPKAQVNIVQRNTGMEFVIESDTEGHYEKNALVPGKYTLTVQATKYRSSSKTVKMSERQILKQDFKLKRR